MHMDDSRFNQVRHREYKCSYAGLRSAVPQCGIVALDCCFALFVLCLIVCYHIFKRNLFCSCATKRTPKIYEYILTYTHDIRAGNTHVLTLFFSFWGIC